MSKNLPQFLRETRQEALKVTWPSRKETITTTVVVFAMIFFVAIVLMLADGIISEAVKFILELGVPSNG